MMTVLSYVTNFFLNKEGNQQFPIFLIPFNITQVERGIISLLLSLKYCIDYHDHVDKIILYLNKKGN